MLPQGSLGHLQTAPELAPGVLVPPHPSSGALPPVHPSQNFLSQRPGQTYQNQELSNLPVQSQVLQHSQNVEGAQEGPHSYVAKQGQRPDGKRLKEQSSPGLPQSSLTGSVGDEEEEVCKEVFMYLFPFRRFQSSSIESNSYMCISAMVSLD